MIVLNPVEARVVGCLIEKEITTPEYYPLSLNALVNACNQKSSRDPLMSLSEAEVRGALFSLEELNLVRVLADARVSKFEHRLRDGLNLRRDEIALVCLLLLRGPQTAAELRARAERLYAFDDNAAANATLERLAGRAEPVTRPYPRQPGAREGRWQQLLTGAQDEPVPAASFADKGRRQDENGLAERVVLLEQRVQALEERLQAMEAGTGTAEQS